MNTLLKRLESTERPFLGPNYWFLQRIRFILPNTQPAKTVCLILHELLTVFTITLFLEIFVLWEDLNLVISSLKITMLTVVIIVKVHTFIIWQSRWREILDYVTEADNFERMDEDPVKIAIVNAYTKYSRRLTYFYWLLTFTTFLVVTQPSLILYVSSSTFRQNLRNGTERFPPIFIAYMPLDKYHAPGCWITYIWHMLMCANGASVMSAYDSCAVAIMVFFGGKLDLLRERCKQMLEKVDGGGVSDDECIDAIKQLHGIHMTLIKHWRLFNSMISPVMFLYVVVWAVMICASAFQLSILVALSFYATGSYQRLVGGTQGTMMSQQSVSRALREVTDALNSDVMLNKWLQFPQTRQERDLIKRRFFEKFKIPCVVGCIDGTHVALVKPSQNEERFYNRKGYHSRNVLIICDADLNIMSVDATYGGATHDSFVWNEHPIKRHISDLTNARERVFLLGDSGYAQREYMMTPILNAPPGSAEEYYTNLHCVARNTVERTIGVLKNRWRCLIGDRVLHYHPDKVSKIINACCVLHNICNKARLDEDGIENTFPLVADIPWTQDDGTQGDDELRRGVQARAQLVQELWAARRT